MINFKFSLEKYSGSNSRFFCPVCGKKEFVRYVDLENGNYLAEHVGRCNRIERCNYHLTPKMFCEKEGIKFQFKSDFKKPFIEKQVYYFEDYKLIETLHSEEKSSNLFNFFLKYFEEEKVKKCFKKYLVGVEEKNDNAVIFWQVDRKRKIRAGKIMKYNSETGRRDKSFFSWMKKVDEAKDIQQVFFGAHLIDMFPNYTIGILESEKTAMLWDLFFDEEIIWIASGGLQGLNRKKFEDLRNREVILFPDLSAPNSKISAYDFWKINSEEISKTIDVNMKINNLLETFASDYSRNNQEDLGDWIIRESLKKTK